MGNRDDKVKMSADNLQSNEELQSRGAPGMKSTARTLETKEESTDHLGTGGSFSKTGGGRSEIVLTGDGNNRTRQSNGQQGYSSRQQILAAMHQLDVVIGAGEDEERSFAPNTDFTGNQTLNSISGKSSRAGHIPAITGMSGQKSLLLPDSAVDTSSEDTSATGAIPKDTTESSGCCPRRRCVIVFIFLLLIAGVAGGVVYYTMIYQSEESVSNLVVTPTQTPKKEDKEPEFTASPSLFPSSLPLTLSTGVPTVQRVVVSKTPVQGSLSPSIPTGTSYSPTLLASLSPSVPSLSTPVFPKIALGGDQEQVTTFYAIGDVPYTPQQAVEIEVQMQNMASDAEFVIHVGDLRNHDDANPLCNEEEYESAADIFKQSPVPVFVIIGDNEWNDCSNQAEGLELWNKHFLKFDSRHWDHNFDVQRQPGRAYNFAFAHKKTLFIGLNIVGLPVQDSLEWEVRLTEQVEWTKELIRYYSSKIGETGRVVIFGQANPSSAHFHFFGPLYDFISGELNNEIPILYVNGDKHEWSYDPSFGGQESLLRIMVTGGSSEPPLQVKVVANGDQTTTSKAFVYDRNL